MTSRPVQSVQNRPPIASVASEPEPAAVLRGAGVDMPPSGPHQFFLNLYPYQQVQMRCGVDRFGFSQLLATSLGLRRAPRSFANWLHGWIWWGAESAEELMFDKRIADKAHLVAHAAERDALLREGFCKVWVAGLPFAYTEQSAVRRTAGSLLVMPPHSSEADKLAKSNTDYLDYICSIRQDFDRVAVCVFHSDFTSALAEDLERRGLQYVIGARPDDANSMNRIRAIFDAFEYVTTNTMGSHVAYSLFSGCKTTIAGPVYPYDERDFGSVNSRSDTAYLSRLLHYLSGEYMQKHFAFLLAGHPLEGREKIDFGSAAIGAHNRLDGASIRQALSWAPGPQVAGYAQAMQSRVSRQIRAFAGPSSLDRSDASSPVAETPARVSEGPTPKSPDFPKQALPRGDLCRFFLGLHPSQEVKIRSGVDRFGFSHVLARRLGIDRVPYSSATWLTDWVWWGGEAPEDLHFDAQDRYRTHVVSHWFQRNLLNTQDFTDVRVGGLPFAYTTPGAVTRAKDALLAMLPRSFEREQLAGSNTRYLDYIASLRPRFDRIAVCVSYLNACPELRSEIERRGLEYVVGARPDDGNALPRMRAMFDSFEFMTTNTPGSHVAYAMYAGCKTSISGPLHEYDVADLELLRQRSGSAYAQRLLYYSSGAYLKEQFGYLHVECPSDAALHSERGKDAVGAGSLLDGREILDILGWRAIPQVRNYLARHVYPGHKMGRVVESEEVLSVNA